MHSNSNSFQFLISNFWQPDSPVLYESQQVAFCCLSCELLVGDVFRISPLDTDLQEKLPSSHQVTQLSSCLHPNALPCLPTPGPQADVTFSPCE